jgi:16S rRNA (cytosine1407-C5)-methyltransferase
MATDRNYGHTYDKDRKYYTKDDIFISRMASILQRSKKDVRSLFSQRIVSAIRLNNLADKPEKILRKLHSHGIQTEEIDFLPYAYIVTNMDKSELGKTEAYKKGLFYIQNISSMLAVQLLHPLESEKVLDLCAAPGSKTTYIASLMSNKGEITAVDEDYKRTKDLHRITEMFYADNVKVVHQDGVLFGKRHHGQFNKVLLDAPCSGEGLIYLQGDNPLRFWSIKKVKAMTSLQKRLIISAFKALKPGGSMIYSTCTLEPDENEGVITHLLNEEENAHVERINPEDITDDERYLKFMENGITKWSGNEYHQECGKTLRIVPNKYMQGFYFAKITRQK